MRKSLIWGLLLLTGLLTSVTAQKEITHEDIWKLGTFQTKSIPGFNFMKDGSNYSRQERTKISEYDITTGSKVRDIFDANTYKGQKGFPGQLDGYSFDNTETKILLESDSEAIYRRSSKAVFHIFDLVKNTMVVLAKGEKISNPSFSPDGSAVAYIKENNLFYEEPFKGLVTQITFDGKKNSIINGMCDWVYEEEFSFTKAYEWNKTGGKLAFLRFDETLVPQFTMQLYHNNAYPDEETFKYPKVGENNSMMSVLTYDIKKGTLKKCNIGDLTEMYIPRIKWTQNKDQLAIFKMNRWQNHLEVLNYDLSKDKYYVLIDEVNKYYIDITDDLKFLENGKEFIWSSEKNGYNHIYLYDIKGPEKADLTPGNFDVISMLSVDEKDQKIYFKAAIKSPMEHGIFTTNFKGKDLKELSSGSGMNNAQFSTNNKYFVCTNSMANVAPNYIVYDQKGMAVRVIEENKDIKEKQRIFGASPVEFFDFTTSEGVKLNGWMIKPAKFDQNKKYPVFMTQYSGPGSQEVTESWMGSDYWWFQMLAQKGYIIACVDPRGTGARGEEFKKMTYLKLGHYETIDQIEAAKYLASLPFVDGKRIGIFGWSYGGYMSSLAILKGNDVFKAAIAVAPVTNWKWYDSVYTERYMRTYKENKDGYDQNSPINFTERLKGAYLLCHGLADDNVHFQNTAEMANSLIDANKQFETYFYPNRNHGIYGGNARIHLFTKMTNFILANL